jgi:hypothetical protein
MTIDNFDFEQSDLFRKITIERAEKKKKKKKKKEKFAKFSTIHSPKRQKYFGFFFVL